jgi:hypothetical protein
MIDKDNIMVGVPENEHGSCRLNCQNEFNLKDFWRYLRLLELLQSYWIYRLLIASCYWMHSSSMHASI